MSRKHDRVLIREATYRRGFTGVDHLIDDDDLLCVRGTYSSLSAAEHHADRVAASGRTRRAMGRSAPPVALNWVRLGDPPTREEIDRAMERYGWELESRGERLENRFACSSYGPRSDRGYWVLDVQVVTHNRRGMKVYENRTLRIRESD